MPFAFRRLLARSFPPIPHHARCADARSNVSGKRLARPGLHPVSLLERRTSRGKKHQIESSMVVLGDDQTYTSMAKTVGLPVAIATLQILNKKITTPGVQLPITPEVYTPILKELENYGIIFSEKELPYTGYNPENVVG